ncbi:MAG TPA: hypothetical protein VL463_11900 [Kofleriaceae bacterium]|nr:hypothetical protein [Kofleriaceae bacterium]
MIAGADPDASWCSARLDEVARAHAAIESPHVPRVDARGRAGAVEYVALACDAVTTLDELLRWSAATRQPPMPYGAAMGLPVVIGDAIASAHAKQICIGSFGARNVLFSSDGRPWVLGFGHDVVGSFGPDARAVRTGSHQAPEVGMGHAPTPPSDLYALDLFFRSMLPYVDLSPMARLAIAGRTDAFSEDAAKQWSEQQRRLTASLPSERYQAIDDVMRVYHGWWKTLGVVPDPAAYAALIAQMIATKHAISTLTVARDASWFRAPGAAAVDLGGRKALRGVLHALASARVRGPGEARAVEDLVVAGWPGERLVDRSGASRVYVAIATLRQLRLGELLQKKARGYLLDPDVPIALA